MDNSKPRILIIDGDEQAQSHYRATLEGSFELLRVDTFGEGWHQVEISQAPFFAIITDYAIAREKGPMLVRLIRQKDGHEQFIIGTFAQGNKAQSEALYGAGCDTCFPSKDGLSKFVLERLATLQTGDTIPDKETP